jgi:hypothetical protein
MKIVRKSAWEEDRACCINHVVRKEHKACQIRWWWKAHKK